MKKKSSRNSGGKSIFYCVRSAAAPSAEKLRQKTEVDDCLSIFAFGVVVVIASGKVFGNSSLLEETS